MEKKFFAGMLIGILCTCIIGVCAYGVVYAAGGRMYDNYQGSTDDSEDAENLDVTSYEVINKLNYIKAYIDAYFYEEVDNEDLIDGIYEGLMYGLGDPYAAYYNADEYAQLQDSSSGEYCGIGSIVSQNIYTGVVTILRPFKDSPAEKAGLLPGDIIYMVDDIYVTGMDLNEVVSYMKGEKGAPVNITVSREGEEDFLTFEVIRDQIEVTTVEYKMLENNIGYILIYEFDEITVPQFGEAYEALLAQGAKGLIVDLRDNPGGLVDSARDILDYLLPECKVVYTVDRYDNVIEEVYTDDPDKIEIPLSVLVNESSASASELFCGAVQDYKIGNVIGTQTFGKGIVQYVVPLGDGTAIKLTAAQYLSPLGRAVHKVGVTPDIVVEQTEEGDAQLDAAVEYMLKQIK